MARSTLRAVVKTAKAMPKLKNTTPHKREDSTAELSPALTMRYTSYKNNAPTICPQNRDQLFEESIWQIFP